MNTISFEVNNQRRMELLQREHDGHVLLLVRDAQGNLENISDEEAFIGPGDFVMLMNYYRLCKRENRPILE